MSVFIVSGTEAVGKSQLIRKILGDNAAPIDVKELFAEFSPFTKDTTAIWVHCDSTEFIDKICRAFQQPIRINVRYEDGYSIIPAPDVYIEITSDCPVHSKYASTIHITGGDA